MTDDADPYLMTLGQIAAELTAIRQELQAMNDRSPEPSLEMFECRSCGAAISGEATAKAHAHDEHGTPADDWRHLYA